MNEVRIIAPQGILGYGFPEASFQAGLKRRPHAIVVDAGSTDAGPHKLGAGVGIVSKKAAKRDLGIMLAAGLELKIPVIIGSAGGSGGQRHIRWTLDIVRELASECQWTLRVAVINATIDKEWLKKELKGHKVTALPGVPTLDEGAIDATVEIVAQMGYEPYMEALEKGVDLIIGGRTYDPSIFVAACKHYMGDADLGLAYHMGKILECGALCALPGSAKDCMMGILYKDDFILEPMNPERKCTPVSVAAHTLYEKSHPKLLPGPGGVLDVSECSFEAVSDSAVRVRGSRFIPDQQYTVKMEGAKLDGYHTILIAGIRDPLEISSIDEVIAFGQEAVKDMFSDLSEDKYFIDFKVYGKNGVLAEWEPVKETQAHELCLVVDVVAGDQEMADSICAYLRSSMMHYHYHGRKATAGNFAFPFAPSEFSAGPIYCFSVYHLLAIDRPAALFPTEYLTLDGGIEQ